MPSLEQDYYEYDPFWNPRHAPLGADDEERIASLYRLVPNGTDLVLDVGCGNGIFCRYVHRQPAAPQTLALDRSRAALKYVDGARVIADMTALPFADRGAMCVVSLEVLEHLPVPSFDRARRELARVARDCLIVSVPHAQVLGEGRTQCPACRASFDPDLHLRSFSRADLARLFDDLGFQCAELVELGPVESYRGLDAARRLFATRPREMASPLCPVCGFRNERFLRQERPSLPPPRTGWLSRLKRGIKHLWPKHQRTRWIAARFTRHG